MVKMDYVYLIKKCTLFSGYSTEELYNLFQNISCQIIDVKKKTLVHAAGEACDNLIIILNGILFLETIGKINNTSFLVHKFIDGDIIGSNLLFSDYNYYKLDIYSKSDCLLLYIPKDALLNLCLTNKLFLESYLCNISKNSQHLIDKINMLSNKNLRQSILNFLSDNYAKTNHNPIYLDMSKSELSRFFGVERTSLSRELKFMKDDGLIDFSNKSITIIDFKSIL